MVSRNDPKRIGFGTSADLTPGADVDKARSLVQAAKHLLLWSLRFLFLPIPDGEPQRISENKTKFLQVSDFMISRAYTKEMRQVLDHVGYTRSMSAYRRVRPPWPDGQTDAEIAQDLTRRAHHKETLHLST